MEGTLEIPPGTWQLMDAEIGLYYAPVSASVGGSVRIRLHAYALAVRGGSGGLEVQKARSDEAQEVYDRLLEMVGEAPMVTAYIRAAGEPTRGSGTKCVVWLEPAVA